MTTSPVREWQARESEAAAGPARFRISARVWLGCVAFLGLVKLLILAFPASFYDDPRLALFDWLPIAIVGAAGLLGVWLSHRTGFPAAWDEGGANRARLLLPGLLGAGFGALTIAVDRLTGQSQAFVAQMGLERFHMPLPASLVFYPGGAIIVEVFYRLLPIPLLLWLASNLLLRGRGQQGIFWVLAILTSAIEPGTQNLAMLDRGLAPFAALFGFGFAVNLSQAAVFRRAGFLAALVVRLGDYFVWHVLYGGLICRC
jgi:hypothetical protein